MSPNGPPIQLKKIACMEGMWDVLMSVKPAPQAEWSEARGNSNFRWILDGTVMEQIYEGSMTGQTFNGRGYLAFNRFSGKWQHTWSDNIAAILSLYEGAYSQGRLVVIGKETTGESSFYVRVSWFNMTEAKFEWLLETSQDGEDWAPTMKAIYTKMAD